MRTPFWWTAYVYASRKPGRRKTGEYTDAVPLPDLRMWGNEHLFTTIENLIDYGWGDGRKLRTAKVVYTIRKRKKLCRTHYLRNRFRDEWKSEP